MRLQGGSLAWSLLKEGFTAHGQRWLFATQAEGIYRPVGMSGLLSVKTVVPRKGREIWYHDQVAPDLTSHVETFSYGFKGSNPDVSQNQWLRDAMEQQLPLIYFYGVAPGIYEPLFPAFITDWNAAQLRCSLAVSSAHGDSLAPPSVLERRYAMRTVQQRLHQAAFRERVLAAYDNRCALSFLPDRRLIDAAHIIPDGHDLGQPDVKNGICMSKIHHAAYDARLIGIDPDLTIHISERLLEIHDGPLLEGIKALAGRKIRQPEDERARPDRERLGLRFRNGA